MAEPPGAARAVVPVAGGTGPAVVRGTHGDAVAEDAARGGRRARARRHGPARRHAPARASARSRSASSTWVPGDPLSCSSWRYGAADEPASLPSEFDRNNYKRTSLRDPNPALSGSLQNLCGQKGSAVDLAWGLTEGSPAVSIAVLDSGIRWRDHDSMVELATKAHINLGEAQPPCYPVVADGDCNHDGVFNITDFGAIPDLNGNGIADPEDLILSPTYSDHVDDDHNGYVDDISGWDFLYGDNDPLDTVDYGHGTGEAKDSTAAATAPATSACAPRASSCRCAWATRSSPTEAASPRACSSRSTPASGSSRRRWAR